MIQAVQSYVDDVERALEDLQVPRILRQWLNELSGNTEAIENFIKIVDQYMKSASAAWTLKEKSLQS